MSKDFIAARDIYQRKATPLDIKKIKNILGKAKQHIVAAKDKDLVLFIGRTGAGKSVAINYMMGVELEKVVDEEILEQFYIVPKPGQNVYSEIGHGSQAETLYPITIPYPKNDFMFCDCPGFEETSEDHNVKIATSLSLQLLIKSAKSIKAVIVCVPYADILDSRKLNFRRLLKTLDGLFKDYNKVLPSCLFAITTVNKKLEEKHILTAIKKFTLDEQKQRHKDLAEDNEMIELLSKEELEEDKLEMSIRQQEEKYVERDEKFKITKILACMEKSKKNLVIFNPLDRGQSKKNIFDFLKESKPVPRQQFILPESTDPMWIDFNCLLLDKAYEGIQLIGVKNQTGKKILKNNKKLLEQKAELRRLKDQQIEIKENKSEITDMSIIINEQKRALEAIQLQQEANLKKQAILKNKISTLGGEIKAIDTEEAVLYWEESKSYGKDPWVVGITTVTVLSLIAIILGVSIGTVGFGTAAIAGGVGVGIAVESGAAATAAGIGAGVSTALVGAGTAATIGSIEKILDRVQRGARTSRGLVRWLLAKLRKYRFSYDDIPYVAAENRTNRGIFYDLVRRELEGIYGITFLPNPYFSSRAEVQIFIAMRDKPENALQINLLSSRRALAKARLTQLERDLVKLNEKEAHIMHDISTLQSAEGVSRKYIESWQETLDLDMRVMEENITLLSKEIDTDKLMLDGLKGQIAVRLPIYEFVIDMLEISGLDNFITRDFAKFYNFVKINPVLSGDKPEDSKENLDLKSTQEQSLTLPEPTSRQQTNYSPRFVGGSRRLNSERQEVNNGIHKEDKYSFGT